MIDNFIPDMYQKSIYTINYEKLKADGIKCLLFDLDNTCAAYSVKKPTEKLTNLFQELKEKGFKIIIFSNNTKRRIEPFKNSLVVDASAKSGKPRKKKFIKIITKFNFDISEVVIIGDQLFTDIYGGNRVGIKTILVNPISKEELLHTKIIKIFENKIYRKLSNKNILVKGKYYE